MELNAETVKKALECCLTTSEGDCIACGYRGKKDGLFVTCTNCLISDALALINSQEQKIKELTLENAGFEAGAKAGIKVIRANTVREMQAEIINRCVQGGIYPAFVAATIDKIANDLLKEKENENC